MAIIRKMDLKLADMIAAGEVVDRPASIVKELVENAIDANAKHIQIMIEAFGMKSIQVIDDGTGMDHEDAQMAFFRHATSKVHAPSDLNQIQTLGFRGEALAAIGAVSKVHLSTKTENTEGIEVIYHGGKQIEKRLTPMNRGTDIRVFDLFYNTPARFKYIKSELAEKNAIIDLFDRLALAHPNIRFSLMIDQKRIKETYGDGDFYQLIAQIYGKQLTKGLITFNQKFQKISIQGFLVDPNHNRSRKKDISIFINGRYIKNYALIQAVVEGYHSLLMTNRYPIAMIYLEMDPSLLDVNVHPQKLEVKLMNELMIAYQLTAYIKAALTQTPHQIHQPLPNELKPTETYQRQALDLMIAEDFEAVSERVKHIPDFDYIGSFAGTYLMFQNQDGLYLIDQHAAQERIRYAYYQKAFENPVAATRQRLIPKVLSLTAQDIDTLKTNQALLKNNRFEFNHQMELISQPTWLKEDEVDLAIESIISMLEEKQTIDILKLRDHLAKDLSCKASIKANQALSLAEVNQLIADLRQTDQPYHCPHGRPTIIFFSHRDIERLFKRVI